MGKSHLEKLYLLIEKDVEEAGDFLYDSIDKLLLNGSVAELEHILLHVDVSKLNTSLMRSFLVVTMPIKHLGARHSLYNRIRHAMVEIRGEPITQKLIGKLQ